jgi:hypothetical protein
MKMNHGCVHQEGMLLSQIINSLIMGSVLPLKSWTNL